VFIIFLRMIIIFPFENDIFSKNPLYSKIYNFIKRTTFDDMHLTIDGKSINYHIIGVIEIFYYKCTLIRSFNF